MPWGLPGGDARGWTRTLERGQMGPLPPPISTFDTIYPIDMIFGTFNKLPRGVYLVSKATRVTSITSQMAAILDFQVFRFYSNFNYSTSK